MIPQRLLHNLRRTVSAGDLTTTALPLAPSVRLYLLSPDFPTGPLQQEEMLAILESPAYWSFCWASGHVFARYLVEHREWVEGRVVADFGCGSGVVAVAAALAGAARVYGVDIDPDALDATRANAELNGVEIITATSLDEIEEALDLIVAADVLYDRDNYHFLAEFRQKASTVLVADSRMREEQLEGYAKIASCTTTTLPDIGEADQFNEVKIYRSDR